MQVFFSNVQLGMLKYFHEIIVPKLMTLSNVDVFKVPLIHSR